jgi:hypothetical protein
MVDYALGLLHAPASRRVPERLKLDAASWLADRGLGKPAQPVTLESYTPPPMFLMPGNATMRITPTPHGPGCECQACNPKRLVLPAVREPDEIVQPAQLQAGPIVDAIDVEATESKG